MQHTLLAVFDNRSDADKAHDALVAGGFPRQQLRLYEGAPGPRASPAEPDMGPGIAAGIRHFLTDIFATDRSEHAQMVSAAVTSGHHVLRLESDSAPALERAGAIVRRFGPLDMDQHMRQRGWQGSAHRAGGVRQAGDLSQQSGGGALQGAPASAQAGSQQRMPEPPLPDIIGRRETAEDAWFRSHWTTNYAKEGGEYDDVAPAYWYGSTMARSEQYRGRAWHEVESSVRRDWEARYPESAWEKFKAAVRHGWERITS